MSTYDVEQVRQRLTQERLSSYLAAAGNDADHALALYDWNTRASGCFYEELGRVEVVLRNTFDAALVALGQERNWTTVWYRRASLFQGRQGARALDDIEVARRRATRGGRAETYGRVIAELTFGFWRYLCTSPYLTSMWVPALAAAFPHHPDRTDPRRVRRDVDDHVQRLWFLRNRVAHREPIHSRNLQHDHENALELIGWMSGDGRDWIAEQSRWTSVAADRP